MGCANVCSNYSILADDQSVPEFYHRQVDPPIFHIPSDVIAVIVEKLSNNDALSLSA
jgi:hypothetical protein